MIFVLENNGFNVVSSLLPLLCLVEISSVLFFFRVSYPYTLVIAEEEDPYPIRSLLPKHSSLYGSVAKNLARYYLYR